MKNIVIDTYEFETVNGEDCIYVDKTAFLHRILTRKGRKMYFITRPRRFGKSLMIDTLEHILRGHRELFKGLAIDRTDYDWTPVNVLRFDFSGLDLSDIDTFRREFAKYVGDVVEGAGCPREEGDTAGTLFRRALNHLGSENGGCAVLVDEYEAPIGHAIKNHQLAEDIREEMATFFSQLKKNIKCVRFLMVTGVTRVAKLSFFSALNNLVDLSFEDDYANMLGFTQEELEANYAEHMLEHAMAMGLSYEDYKKNFKEWYDGYCFGEENQVRVYNPISVSLALNAKKKSLYGYWSATGKSTTLVNALKKEDLEAVDLDKGMSVPSSAFDVSEFKDISAGGLLYQAGYLTKKRFRSYNQSYDLCVPNKEVRMDYETLKLCLTVERDVNWVQEIGIHLQNHDWERFRDGLAALYAGKCYGPTERVQEFNFQRILDTLLMVCHYQCRTEDRQSAGQADIVAQNEEDIFIFELKVDEPPEEALAQIRKNNYAAPYLCESKGVYAIGISFDRQTRRLTGLQWECLKERGVI